MSIEDALGHLNIAIPPFLVQSGQQKEQWRQAKAGMPAILPP